MIEYVNAKIPIEFRDRFNDLNKKHSLGYASFAEIIKECLRRRFEEIETTYKK